MKTITNVLELSVKASRVSNSQQVAQEIVAKMQKALEDNQKALEVTVDQNDFKITWSIARAIEKLVNNKNAFRINTDKIQKESYTQRLVNSLTLKSLERIEKAKQAIK